MNAHAMQDAVELDQRHPHRYVAASTVTALHTFILKCWNVHYGQPLVFPYPYTALIQSSGYGKTRALKELANSLSRTDNGASDSVRGLFIYLKSSAGSTLRDYLFSPWKNAARVGHKLSRPDEMVETMVERLVAIYAVVIKSWGAVGQQWGSLFDLEVDAANITIAQFRLSESNAVHDCSQNRVVVLAIDEAGWLLEVNATNSATWFSLFLQALNEANKKIQPSHGVKSGMFAVLADTNAKVSDFTPPSNRVKLFPPFVLTHTFDVFHLDDFKQGRTNSTSTTRQGVPWTQFYMDLVAHQHADEREAHWSLLRMGRPRWFASLRESNQPIDHAQFNTIVSKAQLLLIKETAIPPSLGAKHLFGVSSLLCRTGLRPLSLSTLAARLPADFMSTLAYVSFEREAILRAFPSEPVLALAACKLWYRDSVADSSPLAEAILPQLYNLCSPGPTDTGEIGEIVARVVLLLMIDVTSASKHASNLPTCSFDSVTDFISQLPLLNDPRSPALERVKKRWAKWNLEFSHFVALERLPTVGDLWCLLSRRAAAVCPRNQTGLDLLIPIFRGMQVSVIVIQIKNHAKKATFTKAIGNKMTPRVAFNKSSELRRLKKKHVLGVFMSMRGHQQATTEITKHGAMDIIVVKGISDWPSVLSNGVVEQLKRLLSPWEPALEMVKADLKARKEAGDHEFQTGEEYERDAARVLKFHDEHEHKTDVTDGICVQTDQGHEPDIETGLRVRAPGDRAPLAPPPQVASAYAIPQRTGPQPRALCRRARLVESDAQQSPRQPQMKKRRHLEDAGAK